MDYHDFGHRLVFDSCHEISIGKLRAWKWRIKGQFRHGVYPCELVLFRTQIVLFSLHQESVVVPEVHNSKMTAWYLLGVESENDWIEKYLRLSTESRISSCSKKTYIAGKWNLVRDCWVLFGVRPADNWAEVFPSKETGRGWHYLLVAAAAGKATIIRTAET